MLRAAGLEASEAQAREMFRDAIASGRALDVFRRFIAAQSGDPRVCDDYSLLPAASLRTEFRASVSGFVEAIDAFLVGMAAIDTGAGRRVKEDTIDYGSGFIFQAKVGDQVKEGQTIVTVFSDHPERMPAVLERLGEAIRIGQHPVAGPKLICYLVDKNCARPWP